VIQKQNNLLNILSCIGKACKTWSAKLESLSISTRRKPLYRDAVR